MKHDILKIIFITHTASLDMAQVSTQEYVMYDIFIHTGFTAQIYSLLALLYSFV